MNEPKEDETLMEQILNQDIIPIEECLTIIDNLDNSVARMYEVSNKIKEEYE